LALGKNSLKVFVMPNYSTRRNGVLNNFMPKKLNLIGQKFGRWTVLEYDNSKKQTYFFCRCECGSEKSVYSGNLVRGKSISCGCHRAEFLSDLKKVHGKTRTKLHGVWMAMRRRCYLETTADYKNYGARGIRVCDEWQGFQKFQEWAIAAGYKEGLSIDRIDSNGNYEPSNCRWATRKVQNNNKRDTHFLTINGESKTITEWSNLTGISRKTIHSRIKYGWPEKDLLNPIVRSEDK
jgi:hypothetical protein